MAYIKSTAFFFLTDFLICQVFIPFSATWWTACFKRACSRVCLQFSHATPQQNCSSLFWYCRSARSANWLVKKKKTDLQVLLLNFPVSDQVMNTLLLLSNACWAMPQSSSLDLPCTRLTPFPITRTVAGDNPFHPRHQWRISPSMVSARTSLLCLFSAPKWWPEAVLSGMRSVPLCPLQGG